MFKLESYVTPILLDYLSKYVKNIRPEDLQVSLWEGEVSLHNLDLRLDVLQEEIHLPLEFLSGHIHDLSIRVPWTKITSEPITITINTIEFVLKLKNPREDGAATSASSSPQRSSDLKKKRKLPAKTDERPTNPEASSSWIVSKIINNISLQCHNIIFKYIEEDIVISMNVQLLSFTSANEKWESAMIDVHPVKVLMRKLVQISDLTICLDKRNAAGQIDVCQEPILYRSSLECRILLKYNANNPQSNRITRIGVFTKLLDMNISSMQIPLCLRLVKLTMAVKDGNCNKAATPEALEDVAEEEETQPQDQSYLAWAWNMLPSINFAPGYEDEPTNETPCHTIDIGFYAEQLSFTLKNAEFIGDTHMTATKRIRYSPIVRLTIGGMFLEFVSAEARNWTSAKAGVTYISIEPLGSYKSNDGNFVQTVKSTNLRPFLDKSLFDDQCLIADKGWGVTNYAEYSARITDDYLLFRSPTLALDFIQYKMTEADKTDAHSSGINSGNAIDANRIQYRFLTAGITFRYTQTLEQVKQLISEFITSYDYPAYYTETLDGGSNSTGANSVKLPPPLMEDYDALMQYIPLRTFKFSLKNLTIEVHAAKSEMDATAAAAALKQRDSQSQPRIHANVFKTTTMIQPPHCLITISSAQGTMETPLYPDKLVHTTCQLPDKPRQLLDSCYEKYEMDFKDISCSLVNHSDKDSRILHIPNFTLKYEKLLQPLNWKDEDLELKKFNFQCEKIELNFTRREWNTCIYLYQCVERFNPSAYRRLVRLQSADLTAEDFAILKNKFIGCHVRWKLKVKQNIWSLNLYGMESVVSVKQQEKLFENVIFGTTPIKGQSDGLRWLECDLLLPLEDGGKKRKSKTAFAVWMAPFFFNIDTNILKFLRHRKLKEMEKECDAENTTFTRTLSAPNFQSNASLLSNALNLTSQPPPPQLPSIMRRTSRHSLQRKISHPEETIHLSSERDEKLEKDTSTSTSPHWLEEKNGLMPFWLSFINSFVVYTEIESGAIYIADDLNSASVKTKVLLPRVHLRPSSLDPAKIHDLSQLQSISNSSKEKSNTSWTLALSDFGVYCEMGSSNETTILQPIQTTVTIALLFKNEKIKCTPIEIKEENEPPPSLSQSDKMSAQKEAAAILTSHQITRAAVSPIGSDYLSSASATAGERSDKDLHDNTETEANISNAWEMETPFEKQSPKRVRKNRDVYTFNLHADTTPIRFFISNQKIRTLENHISILMEFIQRYDITQKSHRSTQTPIEKISIVTATEEHALLKEFMDLETNSENSKYSDDKKDVTCVMLMFCQWTITRIALEVEASPEITHNSKVIIDLEDLLSTLDMREDYTKCTSKMGNFNVTYYEGNPNGDWTLADCLTIRLLGETTNLPFLNVVYTAVGLKQFFKRIGVKRKGDLNRNLNEILIKMQAFEMIVNLDKISKFVGAVSGFFENCYEKGKTLETTKNDKTVNAAHELPMIHLDSKGFALYLPFEKGRDFCSVAIFRVQSIRVTPNLENPLQRKPLRADIFAKAAQLGMLDTPGAMIEDRQYELTLENISAASGNWNQISKHMTEQRDSFIHTNPAFEWNNQNRKQELHITDIFQNFCFVGIYAPAIVYQNILISGQTIEFNCATDYIASLNLYQLNMISCLILHLQNILCYLKGPETRSKHVTLLSKERQICATSLNVIRKNSRNCSIVPSSKLSSNFLKRSSSFVLANSRNTIAFNSIDEDTDNLPPTSDSGFQSCASQLLCNERLKESGSLISTISSSLPQTHAIRNVPQTISLVAGVFLIKFYDLQTSDDKVESDETSMIHKPLFSITFSQPSFMYTQSVYESNMQFSLYDFFISLATTTGGKSTSSALEFNEIVVETRPGQANAAGITPSMFNFRMHCTKMKLRECDIDIAKPIAFQITESKIKLLIQHILLIYTTLLQDACFEIRSKRNVIRGSKIRLMRQQYFDADRLHATCCGIIVSFESEDESYNCKLIANDINFNMKFLNRPEKAMIKASVCALYLLIDRKAILHPVNIRLSAEFISEPWHQLPLVTSIIKFNVLHLDVGINSVLHLQAAIKGYYRIMNDLQAQWQKFLLSRPFEQEDLSINIKNLELIKCPREYEIKKKKSTKASLRREEFYQDDLRAGAFQYVELNTDTFLPMPYQIQIIKKNFGIICWRYPQPRKMNRIHVYPVPMALPNPIHIKCRMEYYSETHETFLHFCDFSLSETVSKQIQLPQRQICANIWRVVIVQSLISINGECFDDLSSDDSENQRSIPSIKIEDIFSTERKESDFIIHPKVLVGCMRIDTIFESMCVPKIQLLLSCNFFTVKLLNQPNRGDELPNKLKEYKLIQTTEISQAFLIVNMQNINIHTAVVSSENYTIESNVACGIKCLDYGYLNMIPLLEETTIQSLIRVETKKRPTEKEISMNLVLDRMRLNVGPTIIHSLFTSKMHWEEFLVRENKRCVLIPRCIIVNRTYTYLTFGQTGTTERIQLQVREACLYSFRSEYHNQKLTFFITDAETEMTEASQSVPISLKYNGDIQVQAVRVGQKCIFIKSRKLSPMQIYVLIKGQIEFISMIPHDLRLDFRCENNSGSKKSIEYFINGEERSCFYYSVEQKSKINMRLKFANNTTMSRARSGDIPLRSNKNLPWLVKIPHAKFEFISFWVRIFREDIKALTTDNFKPQKILITIWPIYEICSMLPMKVEAIEDMTLEELQLLPEGKKHVLQVPATHLTEHLIKFKFQHEINNKKSKDEFILTLKKLDWKDFFYYDEEFWNVEDVIEELAKDNETKWPCSDAEEMRVQRVAEAPNCPTIIYNCMRSRQLSCTLNLEISPWGYFINSTSQSVGVRQQETNERFTIESNGLQMLFEINQYFTLQIADGTNWIETAPIYLQDAINFTPTNNQYYLLSMDMPLDIVILRGSEVIKFVLSLQIENNRRIMILRSKFIVTNFTKRSICILPFAMDHKETATREHVEILDAKMNKLEAKTTASKDDSIGIGVDYFYDLHSPKAKRSIDTAFVCFVCIKISSDSDISIPIPLSMTFTRRCFSAQMGAESIAFAVTLIEQNGIYYLNVFHDISPALLINNQTDMQFLIAQTNASENSKVNNTTPEYLGRNFEWFQLLKSYSNCYYTPPEMYLNFPDIDSATCNLTLALHKDKISKRDIKWSKPIRADKSWEKFLQIPNHGDVKIIICDKHRVIRISIFYILQQREFSVKDLRSRLLTTHPTSAESEDSLDSIATHPNSPSKNSKHIEPCIHHKESINDLSGTTRFRLHAYAKEIVFTLHNDDKVHDFIKTEVFSIYVDDFLLAYNDDYKLNPNNRSLSLIFTNLQIDNQLHSNGRFDFPVIICAQELYERMTTIPQTHYLDHMHNDLWSRTPMMTIKLKFYDDELCLSDINCSMSPFRAYIEDAYLNELFDALVECLPSNCLHIAKTSNERIQLSKGQTLLPREIAAQAICIAEPLHLRSFRIDALNVLLSVHTSVRLYIALDHSPLSFSSYQRHHILTMPLRFGQSLGMHYLSGAIFGAGWVVGSLEILGSPSGLARSFSTGLRDFVAMPVQGLFRGPWGFIVGVTQGSASLLRNVTAGTVNSLTKLAASVARNLDRLSLDREHIERTEALRRVRPNSLTEGFSQGLTGLGISMLGAVGGIAHHTLEARSPAEVVAGVGKGIVGAFTKPISGAAELVALTGQGVLQTVGFNALPKQRQPSGILNNTVNEPSAYRIWKLLPSVLGTDQVLFYHEITLSVQNQMRSAYIFLTSTVFAIMVTKWDKLELAYPVNKVEITRDREDKTLFFLHLIRKDADEQQNNLSYTTERIMNFLRSSLSSKESVRFSTNSLNESLSTQDQPMAHKNLDWAFYINDQLGEHLMQYLKILANEI